MFTCGNAFSQNYVLLKAVEGSTKYIGGSTVAGHIGEIDLLAYSTGASKCVGCSVALAQDLNFIMSLNPSVISFNKALTKGTVLTSVDLVYRRASDGVEFYKIHMENVRVSSVSESGSSDNPTIAISLTPEKTAWQQFKTAGTTAKTSYGWNFTTNTEWSYVFP